MFFAFKLLLKSHNLLQKSVITFFLCKLKPANLYLQSTYRKIASINALWVCIRDVVPLAFHKRRGKSMIIFLFTMPFPCTCTCFFPFFRNMKVILQVILHFPPIFFCKYELFLSLFILHLFMHLKRAHWLKKCTLYSRWASD